MQGKSKKETEKEKMTKIAESKEAKALFEQILKTEEPAALTTEGKIKEYKINYDKLKYSPMGGLIVYIVVNNDEKLFISTTISKEENGKLDYGGYAVSAKLSKFLKGE